MKEIVTIDGKQFELTTEYPLTEQQRQQTISDIRKQSWYNSYNKIQNLGNGIQTLAAPCIDVIVQAPAAIVITNITIGETLGTEDSCLLGTCNPVICSNTGCTVTRKTVVTFENSGDIDQLIIPKLSVGTTEYTTTIPASVTVPARATPTSANGTIDVMFDNIILNRGSNNICVTFTT